MKKIFVIVFLLLCVTSGVFAREQKINIENTILTFNIPDSYDIIDRNHPDPAVLKKLETTADEVIQGMIEDRNFLDCIDFDAKNEIVFIAINTEGTKRYGDLKKHKALINSPNFKDTLVKTFSTPEIEVTNVSTQEFPNATYAVLEGNLREPNEYGNIYSKMFITVKNGTMFVVKGMSWNREHSKVDSALDTVINTMHFTTPVQDADSRAAERVTTEVLIIVFIVAASIIVYWIHRKIKEKKNTNSQPPLTIENIRELKQLLDDGIITQEDFDAAKKKILG